MGKKGRFGKYGEIKRFDRLRRAKTAALETNRPHMKTKRKGLTSKMASGQSPALTFREAGHIDVAFMAQLSRRVFSAFGPYEEMIPTWLMYETTVTIVACIDGIPVGFAMIGDPFSRYDLRQLTELLAIAVDPEKQRKGIGGLLLSEAEKKATELGIRRIFLHTATGNLPARRLFTQAGYRPWEIKRSFYPKGQDAIAMLKNL